MFKCIGYLFSGTRLPSTSVESRRAASVGAMPPWSPGAPTISKLKGVFDARIDRCADQLVHTLSVRAARTFSNPTLTAPQMLAVSPRWLLHLLPWVNIEGGTYQVNRRRIVLTEGRSHRGPDRGGHCPAQARRVARSGAAAWRGRDPAGSNAGLLVDVATTPAMISTKRETRVKSSTSSSRARSKSRLLTRTERSCAWRSMATETSSARPRFLNDWRHSTGAQDVGPQRSS